MNKLYKTFNNKLETIFIIWLNKSVIKHTFIFSLNKIFNIGTNIIINKRLLTNRFNSNKLNNVTDII